MPEVNSCNISTFDRDVLLHRSSLLVPEVVEHPVGIAVAETPEV